MKIALVFPGCHRGGGVERIIWEAAKYLSVKHEVHLVACDVPDLPAGVQWHRVRLPIRRPPLSLLAFSYQAARALKHIAPDVSVTYGSQCPRGDVYVVNSVHRSWLENAGTLRRGNVVLPAFTRFLLPSHLVLLALERYYYGKPPRALAPCAAQVTSDLKRLYHFVVPNTVVIPNGYDPDQFSPERRARLRPAARAALKVPDGRLVMLMVANEWQRKGLGVTLEAFAKLQRGTALLVLAGRQEPTPFATRINELGLQDEVFYIGPSSDVSELHAAADVFVMPTQYEAFALVVVEALASGLPVVTTTVPGAGDLVTDGLNGFLLDDPHDASKLRDLLVKSFNKELLTKMSSEAARSVRGLEWPSLMNKLEKLLYTTSSA